MTTRTTFNGQEYDSPDDMPPDVRTAYQRAMELLQKGRAGGVPGPHVNIKLSTKLRIVHDGNVYDNPDQMPPEARQKYESAMQQIDKDHNGVPDFLEGDTSVAGAALPGAADDTSYPPSTATAPISGQPPVIALEQNSNRLLIVAGAIIVLLLLVVLGLVLYVFFH